MPCGHSIAASHDSVELGTRDKRATARLRLHHHAQALQKADLRGPIFQRRADLIDLRIGEVWPWIVHVSLHEKAPHYDCGGTLLVDTYAREAVARRPVRVKGYHFPLRSSFCVCTR